VPARAIDGVRAAAIVTALADSGWPVAVTGGPSEARLCATAAGDDDGATDLAGTLDLPGLAGVLAGAAAVVCGNTGPAHLAAAVGTPVVSVFAPVVPAHRWRPWGVPTIVLGDQRIACAGCRARVCPVAGQPCLAGVAPEAVVQAVATLARPPAGAMR
jgi:ADP-heptose:LPS heptosyltransferase